LGIPGCQEPHLRHRSVKQGLISRPAGQTLVGIYQRSDMSRDHGQPKGQNSPLRELLRDNDILGLPQWCQDSPIAGAVASHIPSIRFTYAEKRADERTRTAFLLITSENSCVAGVCKSPIPVPVSFLCLALRCTVLRSRWCQSGVSAMVVALHSLFEGEANPSFSSGSKESRWGSSVITPSFLLPGPLSPSVRQFVQYAHALCYLFHPEDWVLAPGVDNLRADF
jgi:hypothetical protein